MKTKKIKGILSKAVPLWMVLLVVLNSTLVMGVAQYYLIKQQLQKDIKELSKSLDPAQMAAALKQEVLPQKGYMTSLKWKDLGKQLVEAGAIDKQKYEQIFTYQSDGADHMKYMDGSWDENIIINEANGRFLVNTFWALGLVNKSKVLDEGPMRQQGMDTANLASTAGWTLGSKGAMELYSSVSIIPLTDEQQDLVKRIAENVFRPCCGNSTYFPDCNHGMAALGYIELAVSSELSENQIYKDLLAFNSFWFPQNYVDMAVYFDKQGTKWKDVDPKLALSSAYSSSQGAQRIKQSVQSVPGVGGSTGGCGT
ncbi:MAG: hypothetical protein Q8P92_01265 [Candidatus Daviesbacteria bacterium]|nr:hypothetical protein [Candidatus Daviesbacteria bacterium]